MQILGSTLELGCSERSPWAFLLKRFWQCDFLFFFFVPLPVQEFFWLSFSAHLQTSLREWRWRRGTWAWVHIRKSEIPPFIRRFLSTRVLFLFIIFISRSQRFSFCLFVYSGDRCFKFSAERKTETRKISTPIKSSKFHLHPRILAFVASPP